MATKILTWVTPTDPGGGNPGRNYNSPLIGAGWTGLYAVFTSGTSFSGAFKVSGEASYWFNTFPAPPGGYPSTVNDPDALYATNGSDTLFWTTNDGSAGAQFTVELWGIPVTASVYCEYGTQMKAGTELVYYLTPGLLDVWLGTVGLAWLAPFLTAFWFTTLDTARLCGSGPPVLPAITSPNPDDLNPTQVLQVLQAVAWANLCECKTGVPSPTPYPTPTQTEPTGTPTLPTFTCNNTDVCATLVDIWQDLATVQKQLNNLTTLVTLIQRQEVPFGYLTGTVHSGLTGNGDFAVSGILGLFVSLSSVPNSVGEEAGDPVTLFDAGWINVGDSSGWRSRERIRSQQWVHFPQAAGEVTRVGYSLNPLVTATITELRREP